MMEMLKQEQDVEEPMFEQKDEYLKKDISIKEGIQLDKLKNRYKNDIRLQKKDLDMLEDEDDKDLITTNVMDLEENQQLFNDEIMAKEEEKQLKQVNLAGWGDWTGFGVEEKPRVQDNTLHQKRLKIDRKANKVIRNTELSKNFRKHLVSDIPHEYRTREQFNMDVGLSIGPEWNGLQNSKNFSRGRITARAGEVIKPLDTRHLPKTKFL